MDKHNIQGARPEKRAGVALKETSGALTHSDTTQIYVNTSNVDPYLLDRVNLGQTFVESTEKSTHKVNF